MTSSCSPPLCFLPLLEHGHFYTAQQPDVHPKLPAGLTGPSINADSNGTRVSTQTSSASPCTESATCQVLLNLLFWALDPTPFFLLWLPIPPAKPMALNLGCSPDSPRSP